ncbi:hypothetical protein HMPREF1991_02162 [Hoylesella loescheii DSM 19665 = JCM 12249 = ATCC 15930]|uniref:Uncharacterized protein n=1 Tax=Hoylesella loescheii DSM 19665 = JCM 12249 = ATCC 15930 TaxID=1122985 RepID=A0A069QFV2_HOYLO|nr:hypothetical protein HMPREF1991_02162 [Hoylesella loescheii DSM 19665 = JCM 12249 = ATCC 15930]
MQWWGADLYQYYINHTYSITKIDLITGLLKLSAAQNCAKAPKTQRKTTQKHE